MTNINSGTAVLKEITSQNHWHVASMKTFICFVQSLTHGQGGGEGGESERANKAGVSASGLVAVNERQRVGMGERQRSHNI